MHIGQFKGDAYTWLGHDIAAADLEKLMDEYQLDMCVVMAPTNDFPDKEGLARAIKGHPRLVAWPVVNPYGPGDAALQVAGLSKEDEAMVMGGSLARLMKLDKK